MNSYSKNRSKINCWADIVIYYNNLASFVFEIVSLAKVDYSASLNTEIQEPSLVSAGSVR